MPCSNIRTYRSKVTHLVELYWLQQGIPIGWYIISRGYYRSFDKLGYRLSDEIASGMGDTVHLMIAHSGAKLVFPKLAWDSMPVSEQEYFAAHGSRSLSLSKRWIDKKTAPVLVQAPTSMADFLSDATKKLHSIKS